MSNDFMKDWLNMVWSRQLGVLSGEGVMHLKATKLTM